MNFYPLSREKERVYEHLAKLQRRARVLAINRLLARSRIAVLDVIVASASRGTKSRKKTSERRLRDLAKRRRVAQRRMLSCERLSQRVLLQIGLKRFQLSETPAGSNQ